MVVLFARAVTIVRRSLFAALFSLVASVAVPLIASSADAAVAPAARDGDAATTEEFRAAEVSGTAVAWKLFIARNPDHPLAREARRRLAALEAE